ncbi:MAG: 7-cyano-7-deazaguanine synthase [Pseudomonadota bacterium]
MIALLLSGGIDSIALAHWQRPDLVITIDYGQRPAPAEIAAAGQVASDLDIRHVVICVDCSSIGSGDMIGSQPMSIAPASEWWPFRNQLLVTVAGSQALAYGVTELQTGSVASDSLHADGRAEFYRKLDELMSMQEGGIRVSAPAISMSTVQLVKISAVPRALLSWAHSCHYSEFACGACRGCVKHYGVMEELYGVAY